MFFRWCDWSIKRSFEGIQSVSQIRANLSFILLQFWAQGTSETEPGSLKMMSQKWSKGIKNKQIATLTKVEHFTHVFGSTYVG